MAGGASSAAGPFGAGAPSRRPPEGLSRCRQGASSRGTLANGGRLPPGGSVIGLRQVDGMALGHLNLVIQGKINATLLPHETMTDDHEAWSAVILHGC